MGKLLKLSPWLVAWIEWDLSLIPVSILSLLASRQAPELAMQLEVERQETVFVRGFVEGKKLKNWNACQPDRGFVSASAQWSAKSANLILCQYSSLLFFYISVGIPIFFVQWIDLTETTGFGMVNENTSAANSLRSLQWRRVGPLTVHF